MLRTLALFFSFVAVAFAGAATETIQGRVVDVSDGDSLTAQLADGSKLKIRLWGVDAPETGQGYGTTGQPFASKARAQLRRMILRKECSFEIVSRDNNGRSVARVWVPSAESADSPLGVIDSGFALIKSGLAWHDARFAPHASEYRDAAAAARCERRGLWAAREDPVPPWKWRAQQRSRR